jgi:hypothetical protein
MAKYLERDEEGNRTTNNKEMKMSDMGVYR